MKCPCCDQELPSNEDIKTFDPSRSVIRNGKNARLSPMEYRIFTILLQRRRDVDALTSVLYGSDPNGGPNNPANSICVTTSRMNKKLKPLGLKVHTEVRYGRHSLYGVRECAS